MLIDFTVENFRSTKEPVTLSAIAASPRSYAASSNGGPYKRDEQIASARAVEGHHLALLPVLGIFGANASGKSNILRALDTLLRLMYLGAGDGSFLMREIVPFGLDAATRAAPTRLQVRLALSGQIYAYSVELFAERILSERLHVAPPGHRTRRLFQRTWSAQSDRYEWRNGHDFAGPHTQLEPAVEPTEPFLAVLRRVQIPLLKPLFEWLKLRVHLPPGGDERADAQIVTDAIRYVPALRQRVVALLQQFDTGLADLEVRSGPDLQGDSNGVVAVHESPRGLVRWPFEDESLGTRRLYPLAFRVVTSLASGTLVLADELGYNVHANITRAIVRLFQSERTNPKGAQLIFASQDPTLQRGQLLRRDQIWFTAKRRSGSTELYPLTDFRPRKDLALDRAYLDGRFGAVPALPEDEDLAAFQELAA